MGSIHRVFSLGPSSNDDTLIASFPNAWRRGGFLAPRHWRDDGRLAGRKFGPEALLGDPGARINESLSCGPVQLNKNYIAAAAPKRQFYAPKSYPFILLNTVQIRVLRAAQAAPTSRRRARA